MVRRLLDAQICLLHDEKPLGSSRYAELRIVVAVLKFCPPPVDCKSYRYVNRAGGSESRVLPRLRPLEHPHCQTCGRRHQNVLVERGAAMAPAGANEPL